MNRFWIAVTCTGLVASGCADSNSDPRSDPPPPVSAARANRSTELPPDREALPSRPEVVTREGEPLEFPAVDAAVDAQLEDTIALRRDIHAHPELGEREVRTAALVAKRLQALGYDVREGVAKTGIVAVLKGDQPGGVVAWRADMDALPITEQTGLPFASTTTDQWDGHQTGVMHACGHDVHTAVGVGLAAVLADPGVRKSLKGEVVFLFQPAEEGVLEPGSHGAKLMVEQGALSNPRPQAIMGFHTDSRMRVGDIGVVEGGALAATDRFEVEIVGRQSHGAYPQDSIDPVVIASQVVLGLQTIAARTVDTRETVVVTVGKIEAGNRYNIIPGSAHLVGTIRTHDEGVQRLVHDKFRQIVAGVSEAMGGKANVKIELQTPVTYNDPALLASMRPVFERVVGRNHVRDELPHMGGEDFAYFAREIPGLFYFVGVSNPERGLVGKSHTPTFMVDEASIEIALRSGAHAVMTYLADLAVADRSKAKTGSVAGASAPVP